MGKDILKEKKKFDILKLGDGVRPISSTRDITAALADDSWSISILGVPGVGGSPPEDLCLSILF